MTLTPAQQKGFEIGKLYCVLNGYTYADKNDVVEFVSDDGTFCPWFKKIQKAGSCTETFDGKLAIRLGDLEPYNPGTPAQQKSFEIGKLYRFIGEDYGYADLGDIVEFIRDDGSDCPWFEKKVKVGSCKETIDGTLAIPLCDIEPYEQPIATKQKPSHQEILLLYVKQCYPEDRAMIAMVESL